MDKFFLAIFIALAALSFVPPDWEKHAPASWMQVLTMTFGLIAIGAYIVVRPWLG
jgi:hypothetical protein